MDPDPDAAARVLSAIGEEMDAADLPDERLGLSSPAPTRPCARTNASCSPCASSRG